MNKERAPCNFDPKPYAGQPIGMFHCPECGEMVLAGMDHPDWSVFDEQPDTSTAATGQDGRASVEAGAAPLK